MRGGHDRDYGPDAERTPLDLGEYDNGKENGMTRKDYEPVAEALRSTRPRDGQIGLQAQRQWNKDVKHLAGLFSQDNSRFDADRFIEAAGGLVE